MVGENELKVEIAKLRIQVFGMLLANQTETFRSSFEAADTEPDRMMRLVQKTIQITDALWPKPKSQSQT